MNKENARQKKLISTLALLLAHPFIITILASGVLVYVGEGIKNYYGKKQNQYNYLTEVTNKKYNMLAKFTTAFDNEVALLYNLKLKYVWLANKTNKIDQIGRSRKEVITSAEKMWSEYERAHDSQSLLIQITALFDAPSIINRANDLRKDIENFQEIDTARPDSIKVIMDEVDRLYNEMHLLTQDMGAEIKKEINRNTDSIKTESTEQ